MRIQQILLSALALTATGLSIYLMMHNTPNTEHLDEFVKFKSQYNKTHSTQEELEYRFAVFQKNMEEINRVNSLNLTYELGVNQFADLTFEEFKSQYLSVEIDNPTLTTEGPRVNASNIDWRDKKVVTGVKNQGACGSCWAFSTTGSFESALAIKNKKLPSLSEQELVDCSRAQGNYGCGGGLMTNAFNYVKKFKLGTEKDYPYTARNGSCKRKDGERYTISSFRTLSPPNVNQLAKEIQTQPVSVAIEVRGDF